MSSRIVVVGRIASTSARRPLSALPLLSLTPKPACFTPAVSSLSRSPSLSSGLGTRIVAPAPILYRPYRRASMSTSTMSQENKMGSGSSTMTGKGSRAAAAAGGDVVEILLQQHNRIRSLFKEVKSASGAVKQQKFDQLRALLAVHEVAEELVLRPVTTKTAGTGVAEARNQEEAKAATELKKLEGMDVNGSEFATAFSKFEVAVSDHADKEEKEEFPTIKSQVSPDQRIKMGEKLIKAEEMAPQHPHPSAAGSRAMLMMTGPFAKMMDTVRDSFADTDKPSGADVVAAAGARSSASQP